MIDRLVLWPLRRSTGQQGLVATIGLALFLQEYLRLLQGTQPKWIGSFFAGPIALVRADEFTVTVTPIALVLAAGASRGLARGPGDPALQRFRPQLARNIR